MKSSDIFSVSDPSSALDSYPDQTLFFFSAFKAHQGKEETTKEEKKLINSVVRRQITLVKFICLHNWKKYFLQAFYFRHGKSWCVCPLCAMPNRRLCHSVYASFTVRARFLFKFNLLLLRGFSLSLSGFLEIKQRLLLASSILGSHHHHNFLNGSHIKTHNKSKARRELNVVSGTFPLSK